MGIPKESQRVWDSQINRRRFFSLGLAAAALTVVSCEKPVPVSEEKRLEDAGLGDFTGLYLRIKYLQAKFHAVPPLMPDDFYKTLFLTAEGKIGKESLQVAQLRDGWGEKIEEVDLAVEEKIDSLSIDLMGAKDSEEQVRIYLKKIGKILPINILAMPDKLEVLTEGACGGSCFAYRSRERLGIPSPIKHGEKATNATIHESTHALDGDADRITPYVKKADYISYMESYYDYATSLAEAWLAVDEREALELPLTSVNDAVGKMMEIYEENILGELQDEELGINKRYNLTAYRAGSKLIALSQTANHSKEDEAFLNNRYVGKLMEHVLFEAMHNLVGPSNLADPGEPSLAKAKGIQLMALSLRLALQKKRLDLFSTLPKNASLNDFRDSLGFAPLDEAKNDVYEADSSRILKEYGAKKLGEYEYLEGKSYRLFQLPENPFATQRTILYLEFDKREQGQPKGTLISIPKDQYDPNLKDRKTFFDASYAERFKTKRWIDMGKHAYNSSAFGFEISEGNILNMYLNAGEDLNLRPIPLGEAIAAPEDITIVVMEEAPDTKELRWDQTAKVDIIGFGDFYSHQATFDQEALWIEERRYEKTNLFPFPKGKNLNTNIVLLFKGIGTNAVVLTGNNPSEESVFIPEGSVGPYGSFSYLRDVQVVKEPEERYVERREDGFYYFLGIPCKFSEEDDKRTQELFAKNYQQVIDYKLIDDGSKSSPRFQYYLILYRPSQNGGYEKEYFPLSFVKDKK